jgi:hypothetical protein
MTEKREQGLLAFASRPDMGDASASQDRALLSLLGLIPETKVLSGYIFISLSPIQKTAFSPGFCNISFTNYIVTEQRRLRANPAR